ncbi:MAG: MIP/aquaporin family protein [Marmoricola sp.]
MSEPMRKYVTELIGTFFLVFTVVNVVSEGLIEPDKTSPLGAIGIGAILMVMIYAGGHISGAHYNPAVSIAAFVRGRLDANDLAPYIVAQLAGGLGAALLGMWLYGDLPDTTSYSGKAIWTALVVEVLFTFALAYVVLNVATSKDHPDNSFYGLAIGFTVGAGAIAVGPISSAVFNPAVAFGISVARISDWGNIWIYLVAQVIGGVLAGVVFKALNPLDA